MNLENTTHNTTQGDMNMENEGSKEVAPDNAAKIQKGEVLSFVGDSREAIVIDLRTGAAHFANAGHNVMADVMRAVAKRVERLQSGSGEHFTKMQEALELFDGIPDSDLDVLEHKGWEMQDHSEYGGGVLKSLVCYARNAKAVLQSVKNGSATAGLGCRGNMAKIRDAAAKTIEILMRRGNGKTHCVLSWDEFNKTVLMLKAALAAPPRNCDVGTAEEQARRLGALCESFPGISCKGCPLDSKTMNCELAWAQMPYEPKGGE